eukprot:505123-Amphidinium_carterae.1
MTTVEVSRKTPPKPARASPKAPIVTTRAARGSGDASPNDAKDNKTIMVIGGFQTDTKRSVVMETLPFPSST